MSEDNDLWKTLIDGAINHYSRGAVIATLNFIAELSPKEIEEWTAGMSQKELERVYRVWRAAQTDMKESLELLPRD